MSHSNSHRSLVNSAANDRVQQVLDEAVANGSQIGVQVAAYHKGHLIIDAWSGLANHQTGALVGPDTLFNVYSVTKAVAATAVHMQVDRGHLDYDAPIADYWPEFAANGKARATVRDALTHRVGIPLMPEDVTPERMCDWDWMTQRIAEATPLFEPGTKTAYLSMTFGWILGELVRRSDPAGRSLGRYVKQEIAEPLGIADLWIGIPDDVVPRVARLRNDSQPVPAEYLPPLFLQSMPPQVGLVPEVFELPLVRRSEIAGVGGIFTARAEARFWAMLAQGGELDGVRLLSEQLANSLNTPRRDSDEPDPVMFSIPIPLSIGGYWLGGDYTPVCSARRPQTICHPGAGGSIGWADRELEFAAAICHNRMFDASSVEDDPVLPIANAIWDALEG